VDIRRTPKINQIFFLRFDSPSASFLIHAFFRLGDLIIGVIAVVITAVGIYFFGQSLDSNHAAAILLTVLVVLVIVMVINSLLAQRTM
jgi:hypothetical protein